jgi:hypothetical protein
MGAVIDPPQNARMPSGRKRRGRAAHQLFQSLAVSALVKIEGSGVLKMRDLPHCLRPPSLPNFRVERRFS